MRKGLADAAASCRGRISPRNFRVRSCLGLLKNSCGSPSSTMAPLAMKITRSATSRVKPISWVTRIIVMPSSARPTIVSSTSLTISGSRAEVGSSNSITFGSMHSARAMATRCCCPPESWAGNLSAWLRILPRSSSRRAVASASARAMPRERIGASTQFSSTVRCGNRLNCWNTMPSRRMASITPAFSIRRVPSTTIYPPLADRLHAAADDLDRIGAAIDAKRDDRGRRRVELDPSERQREEDDVDLDQEGVLRISSTKLITSQRSPR
jgi:hypothetical protein